jgi:starch synthase
MAASVSQNPSNPISDPTESASEYRVFMNILLASGEVYPYSKTGGLGDMLGAMAKSLARSGADITVVTPLYRGILERFPDIRKMGWRLHLPLASDWIEGELYIREPEPHLRLLFVHQPEFYQRAGLYEEGGRDYPDNARRFIYFAKSVAYLARHLEVRPGVVHVHDWQAGLVPLLIRDQHLREGWDQPPGTCLTIHNLAYQGVFPSATYAWTNLPNDHWHPEGVEFYQHLNCLKAGLVYADRLTTVSPRYAREILTGPFGCGLDGILRRRQDALTGILNGVDYSEWTTTHNPHLGHNYSWQSLEGKAALKSDLQRELQLPVQTEVPLFGSVSRLVAQKGTDLLLAALEEMLHAPMQVVLLGSGDHGFETAYRSLARRYPDRVAIRIGYDHPLAHRIEAASDFFLMPSRFEPCGLNQMYSLRYGSIPIVRATGGLDDSVVDPNENIEHATGIKFFEESARALSKAIRKALVLYADPDLLDHFRVNAMQADFSWERSAAQYLQIYREILGTSVTGPA